MLVRVIRWFLCCAVAGWIVQRFGCAGTAGQESPATFVEFPLRCRAVPATLRVLPWKRFDREMAPFLRLIEDPLV